MENLPHVVVLQALKYVCDKRCLTSCSFCPSKIHATLLKKMFLHLYSIFNPKSQKCISRGNTSKNEYPSCIERKFYFLYNFAQKCSPYKNAYSINIKSNSQNAGSGTTSMAWFWYMYVKFNSFLPSFTFKKTVRFFVFREYD